MDARSDAGGVVHNAKHGANGRAGRDVSQRTVLLAIVVDRNASDVHSSVAVAARPPGHGVRCDPVLQDNTSS